jgi:glycosyltransferase involved in cell wall biosynthesis
MKFNHRFLYISFFFPPLGGAEPRHNLSIVKRLYSNGFLPTVVTAPEEYPYPKDEYLRSLIPQGLDIVRCNWPYKNEKNFRFARRIIKVPENPLVFGGWKNFYGPARRIMKENELDFVYSVHGIGAAHLAALKLKKEFGLPWIAEFRDPWVRNIIAWDYMKNSSWASWYKYQLRRTEKHLKDVLENADLVVVESPVHKELLVEDLGIDGDKIQPFGIGYEGEYFQDAANAPLNFPRKPVLGFLGSVYYGYEPAVESFIGALAALEKEGFEFTMVSVGAASPVFSKYAKKAGLRCFIPISTINLNSSLGMMRMMDFGVIFGLEKDRTALGSKLWDYLNSNLALLAVVPKDSMAARIIEDGDCGYILPYENESMLQVLRQALIDYNERKTKRPKHDYIEQFSSEKMVGKLAERIEELL